MSSPHLAFAGYYGNSIGTNKKILKDVFKPGDSWFRTGDLLRKDAEGLYYFCDRLGDTFRWKSENVATTTVAEALAKVVDHPNVYGVLGKQTLTFSPSAKARIKTRKSKLTNDDLLSFGFDSI